MAAQLSCGEGELEVRGILDRVVGETVTLELVEGEGEFSGKLEMVGMDNVKYTQAILKAAKKSPQKVTFVIPPDVAQGQARVLVHRNQPPALVVPLQINRLAFALDIRGILEILPLPPTTMLRSTMSIGGTTGKLSLSPAGDMLAALTKDQVRLLSVGLQPKNLATSISQSGATCLAALPSGVLVGTDSEVVLYLLSNGIKQDATFAVPGCTEIAVDQNGTVAVVLSKCDTDADKVPDSDCITHLELGLSPTASPTTTIDNTPNATSIQLTQDGKSAVVVDASAIYGVNLETVISITFTKLAWGFAASPVDMARSSAPEEVSGQSVDLFAIAEGTKNAVYLVGIDKGDIKWVRSGNQQLVVSLPETPTQLSFGRRLDLYVASSAKLYRVEELWAQPKLISLGLSTTNPMVSLVAQP